MALSETRLGNAIAAKVLAATGGGTPSQADIDATKAIWTDIAKEILDEFKNFAQVQSTVTVTNVSGVVSGPSTSGPGAGTATGTIS